MPLCSAPVPNTDQTFASQYEKLSHFYSLSKSYPADLNLGMAGVAGTALTKQLSFASQISNLRLPATHPVLLGVVHAAWSDILCLHDYEATRVLKLNLLKRILQI